MAATTHSLHAYLESFCSLHQQWLRSYLAPREALLLLGAALPRLALFLAGPCSSSSSSSSSLLLLL